MTMIIIPTDITNMIFKHRGYELLKDKLNEFHLDCDKFCDYLIKYNGFVIGSFTLSCFDNSIIPNDMDIFIHIPSSEDFRCVYKDFFNVLNKTEINIAVEKKPIHNSLIENDTTRYIYSFNIFDKKIDIIVTKESIKRLYFNIDCSNIIFNGIEWNIPQAIESDIHNFLITKHCSIGNPYLSYFSEIYDPCQDTLDSLISNSNTFTLPKNCNNEDQTMQIIYKALIIYYPELIENTNVSHTNFFSSIEHYYLDSNYYWNRKDSCDTFYEESNHEINGLHEESINDIYSFQPKFAGPGNDHREEIDFNIGDWEMENIFTPSFMTNKNVLSDNKNFDKHTKSTKLLCLDNYLNVARKVFKTFNISSNEEDIELSKLYNIYRAWYRILKYISRGYVFIDIDKLLNLEFANELFYLK